MENNNFMMMKCDTCKNKDIVNLTLSNEWQCPHCTYFEEKKKVMLQLQKQAV